MLVIGIGVAVGLYAAVVYWRMGRVERFRRELRNLMTPGDPLYLRMFSEYMDGPGVVSMCLGLMPLRWYYSGTELLRRYDAGR